MNDKERKVDVVPLLEDIAAESMASSDAELRERLVDAGVNPDSEIQKFKAISRSAVTSLRRQRIDMLPDVVPEEPAEVRSLLEQLLWMPNAPSEAFTLAYRDNKGTSENDLRVLTQHLLELLKKEHGA